MKLDRNIAENEGRGKYAVVKMRALAQIVKENGRMPDALRDALAALEAVGVLDYGAAGTVDEFFLIRLKDEFSTPALRAYAFAAEDYDFEYASEVRDMARRSGKYSEFCKKPD
jgi:hypothetical protein